MKLALPLLALGIFLMVFTMPATAAHEELYPCSQCHANIVPQANVNYSAIHKVNLTVGMHSGLFCSSCHVPEKAMMFLRSGAPLAINGLNSTEELMEVNSQCALCHPRTYEDYLSFAHGNHTYICKGGGETDVIYGYKGSPYFLHICGDYTGLKTVNAKACSQCHDPHDPTFEPPSIMPQQTYRPEPQTQDEVATSGMAATVIGIILVLASPFLVFLRKWGEKE